VLAAKMKAERASVTGKDVETQVQSLLREREVRRTLSAIRAAGGKAKYITCDVSDSAAFRDVIADVAATHKRIDAVIHGAGVIEDKLIVDKSADSFERVMRTKIDPLLTLIETVPRDALKTIVLFTSVAGFFGNRGQADYAAANEVLNRLGEDLRRRWGIKVICLNWGPWDGTGMVSAEVAAQFRSRGIDLIPIEQGRRAVWEEMCHSTNSDVRIILGPGPWLASAGGPERAPGKWQEVPESRAVGLQRLRS
jgi:NAD(P)-dependent dehydrogenase (short-subunit alcohol dehydrogenase family)